MRATQEENEKSGALQSQCWCWQKVNWRLNNRGSKDLAVTLPVVTVQIFHEQINKPGIKKNERILIDPYNVPHHRQTPTRKRDVKHHLK